MFWHETKENDINLISYNKADYLKMMNPKNKKKYSFDASENELLDSNVLDLTDNFKVDMMVPSDWGPGKVISVNKNNKKVVLRIEGNEQEFDMFELHSHLSVYIHVFFKDLNLKDRKVIICGNIFLDDTIGRIKQKIAGIFNADEKKVIIVHKFLRLTNDNQKISECGIFSQDTLLVIINGTCDY